MQIESKNKENRKNSPLSPLNSQLNFYGVFGNIVEETGTTQNPYRYSGYEYDKETKNYYLQSRYYNPKIARFLSEDTYRGDRKDPLSLNLYTYCHNEPLMYVDPDGHRPESQTGNGANGPDKRYAEKMKKAYINFKKLPTPKAKPAAKPKPKAVEKSKSTNKVDVKTTKKDPNRVDGFWGGFTDVWVKLPPYKVLSAVAKWQDDHPKITKTIEVAGTVVMFGQMAKSVAPTVKVVPKPSIIKQSVPNSIKGTSKGPLKMDLQLFANKGAGNPNNLPAVYDADFAAQQILKRSTNVTPGGRTITVHAAERMVTPPAGRVPTSITEVDVFLDTATNIRKISQHPLGDTITLRNANSPSIKEVVVDAATGKRAITVITPKKRK